MRYPEAMKTFSGDGLACVRSNRIVFSGLGFSVSSGQALILSGPNGSGKSSLLRLMARITKPAAGRIIWNETDIEEDPETFFADMHYVGHRDAVKPVLTVSENLLFHATVRKGSANIDSALETVGLSALAGMPARMLSAGQTRRLALARILASPATIWLLDEPTIALDPPSVERLIAAIAKHRAANGIVVASTNAPLGIDDAENIDISDFVSGEKTLWGDSL